RTRDRLECRVKWLLGRAWCHMDGTGDPYLHSWPRSMLSQGDRVSLVCKSTLHFTIFSLRKTDKTNAVQPLQRRRWHDLGSLQPVSPATAGLREKVSHIHLEREEAVSSGCMVRVSGFYGRPSLLISPGDLGGPGGICVLQSWRSLQFQEFRLRHEGITHSLMHKKGQIERNQSLSNYSSSKTILKIHNVHSCYSSLAFSPIHWISPSPPIPVVTTGLGKAERVGSLSCRAEDEHSATCFSTALQPVNRTKQATALSLCCPSELQSKVMFSPSLLQGTVEVLALQRWSQTPDLKMPESCCF
uniref:Uncharacterized protein n=1 Tax=Macaca mulatta TaxID=9544 RepID=A0A5F7ZC84_MACMU